MAEGDFNLINASISLGIDASDFEKKLADVTSKIQSLTEGKVKLDFEINKGKQELNEIIELVTDPGKKISVDFDLGNAKQQLQEVSKLLSETVEAAKSQQKSRAKKSQASAAVEKEPDFNKIDRDVMLREYTPKVRARAQSLADQAYKKKTRELPIITREDLEKASELLRIEKKILNVREQIRKATAGIFSVGVRSRAQKIANQEFLDGVRKTRDLTKNDLEAAKIILDIETRITRQVKEQERARKRDLAEAIRRTYSSRVRSVAKDIAAKDFLAGGRENLNVRKGDLEAAKIILGIEEKITQEVKDQERTRRQSLKEAARLQKETVNVNRVLGSRVLGAITSASQDLGFLFPQAQFVGNIFRVATAFGKLGYAAGNAVSQYAKVRQFSGVFATLAGLAVRLSGPLRILGVVAGVTLGQGLGIAAKAASLLLSALSAVGRVAFNVIASGFRLLLAPTLALVRGFQQLVSYAPLIVAALGSAFVRSVSDAAIQMERFQNLFSVTFPGQGIERFRQLKGLANDLGVGFDTAVEPMARLAFAAKQAGIAASDVDTLFRGVMTASAALQLDTDRLGRAFNALDQAISKNSLTGEELRGQLAEAIPGAVQIVQRALGYTGAQMEKLMKQGKITGKELVQALGPALIKTFRSGAAASANSLAASVARIRNRFMELKATIGKEVAPAFMRLQLSILDVLSSKPVLSFLQRVSFTLGNLFDRIRTSPILKEFADRFVQFLEKIRPGLTELLSKLARIIVVVNGAVIVGFMKLAEVAIPMINRGLDRALAAIEKMTGMRIGSVADSFSFVGALMGDVPKFKEVMLAAVDSLILRAKAGAKSVIELIFRSIPVIARASYEATKALVVPSFNEMVINSNKGTIEQLQREMKSRPYFETPERRLERTTRLQAEILRYRKSIDELEKKQAIEVKDVFSKIGENAAKGFLDVWNSLSPIDPIDAKAIENADKVLRSLMETIVPLFERLKRSQLWADVVQGLTVAIKGLESAAVIALSSVESIGRKINEALNTQSFAFGDQITKSLGIFGNFFGGNGLPISVQVSGIKEAFADAGKELRNQTAGTVEPFKVLGRLMGRILGVTTQVMPNGRIKAGSDETSSAFESQFFGLEEFQRYVQGGQAVSEKIVDLSRQNVDATLSVEKAVRDLRKDGNQSSAYWAEQWARQMFMGSGFRNSEW